MPGPITRDDIGFDPDTLYSAKLLRTPTSHRTFFKWVAGLLLLILAAMFLPWQQNVRGDGTLTALRPQDRPQTVPALIAGRIEQWYVQEGQYVAKGTPIVRISEVKEKYLDPNLVGRLGEQVDGKQASLAGKFAKVRSLDSLLAALERAQAFGLEKAQNKVRLYEAALQAAVVDSQVEAARFERRERLFKDGLSTRTEFEANQLRFQQAVAKLVEKRQEYENARIEVGSVGAEYGEKIAKARSDRDATRAEIGEGQAEVAKLQNEFTSMQIRNGMYRIDAPQDGYVVKALKEGVGETIKEGDPLVTVVPARPQQAVELFVKAMDVPLLKRGRKVRLIFDGWPALQFSGWPSVSVGTFGGVVSVIDAVDSKAGKFRVLVTPDPDDDPWPQQLRMGSGVHGWALLDTVPVWFEIWRQLNGFPPTVDPAASEAPIGGPEGQEPAP
ncbi:MAG TPA: HlyD family efflux transporter periplasmic adaptor subunit [Gemmatimonadales bacterium]|nr:HlyD family efflux transporter periplasmic adaptor subunit [Gemmatimonadales bacterium]